MAKNPRFICDRSTKPLRLSVAGDEEAQSEEEPELISTEAIEKNIGIVYVLKTGTFTRDQKEILKIGITSGDIEQRIGQLYTTGVPLRFQIHAIHKISGFMDAERALHSLLARFRLNSSREFFAEDALPFIDRIIALHEEIKKSASA